MVNFQVAKPKRDEKEMVVPNCNLSMVMPKKYVLFRITSIPPKAPCEGMKSNLSNRRGANFLINCKSICYILVSWRQITEQPLSSILFLTASCFSTAFRPLIFRHSMFQFLLFINVWGRSWAWVITSITQ
jgi:hypothetical protein